MHDIEMSIAAQKKERVDLTAVDNELLVRAGSYDMVKIHGTYNI
jgi:hypothetical protein